MKIKIYSMDTILEPLQLFELQRLIPVAHKYVFTEIRKMQHHHME